MVTAMIRTADDAVDKELDYSRYNLGIRELWNTGNSPVAAGKQLSPGIDVSSLMGGNSLDIGSVFDIAGISADKKDGSSFIDNSNALERSNMFLFN